MAFVFSFGSAPFLPVLMILSDSSPHCDPHPKSSKTYRSCPDDIVGLFLLTVSQLSCWHTIKEMLFVKRCFKCRPAIF